MLGTVMGSRVLVRSRGGQLGRPHEEGGCSDQMTAKAMCPQCACLLSYCWPLKAMTLPHKKNGFFPCVWLCVSVLSSHLSIPT